MTDLLQMLDATWPAAAIVRAGPWVIRDGRGGGQRVSAATADGPWTDADIATAEAAQEQLGQPWLFMVQSGEPALDAALEARGYTVRDPVAIWSVRCADLATGIPPLAAFTLWPPLAIVYDVWADGGISDPRLAIMHRVAAPKTAILSRVGDRVAGAAFVACRGNQAMLHALHILPAARRQGSAANILRAAARWALDNDSDTLSLAVTVANAPANALYASLGMRIVGHYHYRRKQARERHTSS